MLGHIRRAGNDDCNAMPTVADSSAALELRPARMNLAVAQCRTRDFKSAEASLPKLSELDPVADAGS
jgi:hypothetical protein